MNQEKGIALVVDDEDLVLNMEVAMLQKIGIKALKARNSAEACQLFEDEKDHIDLVVLDMVMPDENGATTHGILKRINPDIKVLISTGYGRDGNVEEILADGQNAVILKPFKFDEFRNKIDSMFSLN